MIPALTLDTNCLYDLDEERPNAPYLRQLVTLHREGKLALWVTALSAAENQRGGRHIRNFKEFRERLAGLGLADLNILKPVAVVGLAFSDWCIVGGEEDGPLRDAVCRALFPDLPDYRTYCLGLGLDPTSDDLEPKYRNKLLDILIMRAHIRHRNQAFISRYERFHRKKAELIALGAGHVLLPKEAVELYG